MIEPTRQQKALVKTMADIAEDSLEQLAFQHIVLCHLGFPCSKTETRLRAPLQQRAASPRLRTY